MNTKDLAYFKALVEKRNFTAVAKAFNVSQPTVTQAVKRLEREFEDELVHVDRAHNRTEITRSGLLLYEKASTVAASLNLAHQEIENAKLSRIRFGLPPIIGTLYFPALAGQLLKDGLLQRLDLVETGSGGLLSAVKEGEIDIALLASVLPLHDPSLNVIHIGSRPFVAVVSRRHRLANRGSVFFKELANEEFIMLNRKFVHPKAFKAYSQFAGVNPPVIYRTPDISWITSLVKENLGVSLLVRDVVSSSDESELSCLQILDPVAERFNVSIVIRQGYVLTAEEKHFIEELKQLKIPQSQ
ncbi:LysR family transcriptional regulator [Lactobacillus sp. LC28-10]|uniref:LysR family transcriptional regulator n=1 Tax=Secundilactobacillus angelensis TaxID=2722706 RepID=A0ABX1KVV2_9LACO|nr:LysR family transcriptional regulator [Secundilactobacillus angelensis]MCH5461878.1 LysR family transcriptional regulator [Secundilactobacillus angelensis]NLR17365.1 LysR family transcriptional regulator [Secundilactobacillus angelensis]